MAKAFFVHPLGIVDKGALVGKGTRVWAFAHVSKGARVGVDCNIGETAYIENGAILGDRVTVKNGVYVWEGVVAEDGVFLGPNCTLTNHIDPRSFIKRPSEEWLKKTHLKRGCTIGAGAVIVCGHTVGRYAFVAAGAVVTKDIIDHALVLGNPARFHAWVCRCAEKLRFKGTKARCSRCGDRYVKVKGGVKLVE
jgi:UDP-2-acetamido-3-amino-2,3-dideoxy-glucuronate N-acetyltransferase